MGNMKLTIYGNDPGTWEGCYVSTHMITRALVESFEKRPDVDLVASVNVHSDPIAETVPECDVLLVHNYFHTMEQEFSFDVADMKKRVKIIAMFLELGAKDADISFTYQRTVCKATSAIEVVIPMPIPQKPFIRYRQKEKRTILLDHDYPLGGWPQGMERYVLEGESNCSRLWPILDKWRDKFSFSQLERFPEAAQWRPSWVTVIPQCSYPDYLRRTENFDGFMITHPGSYNHSVVDMAARGIRPFCVYGNISQDLATRLDILQVGRIEDLDIILSRWDTLPTYIPRKSLCTRFDVVAATMVEHFQRMLGA